jgi:SNF2 family DNA or RNA helicase
VPLNLLGFQAEDVLKLKSKRSRLIGNDPGTGKTYEGIALDLANRAGDGNSKVDASDYKVKKTLVLAPKSVLGVWDEHLMDLTDEDVYIYTYHTRERFLKQALDPNRGGYFVMNYQSVRIASMQTRTIKGKKFPGLDSQVWWHIIADECHYIKGRKSQQTAAVKKLRAVYKTAMSGTPADDKPQDLWSVLNWLWPNYYTSFWNFVHAYCNEEEDEETGYSKIVGVNEATIGHLHKEMEPWFVRRRKEDVLTDLPDKYYSRVWVDLHPKQRKAYDQMKKTMIAWVDQHWDELDREDP